MWIERSERGYAICYSSARVLIGTPRGQQHRRLKEREKEEVMPEMCISSTRETCRVKFLIDMVSLSHIMEATENMDGTTESQLQENKKKKAVSLFPSLVIIFC